MDGVFLCQFCLPAQRLRVAQVIVVVVQRTFWLLVPFKDWLGFLYIDPICKSFSPPFVIFRNGVKLWKVICYNFCLHCRLMICAGTPAAMV